MFAGFGLAVPRWCCFRDIDLGLDSAWGVHLQAGFLVEVVDHRLVDLGLGFQGMDLDLDLGLGLDLRFGGFAC